MGPLNSPSCGTIQQWEEAGASLVAAFKDYTDLCLGLGNSSLRGDAWNDLVPRIDTTFGAVHTRISHYLDESTRALARTRNKFASPLFKLPQDVLLEIFLNVVFDRDDSDQFGRSSIEQDTWLIYHRLYDLIGVCSSWRDMIMANGTFWSVIPMVSSLPAEGERQSKLCLQRAGRSTLYLAANLGASMSSRNLAVVLAEHGSRFRTINISTHDVAAIRDAISKLLKYAQHGTLSELFLQLRAPHVWIHGPPNESDYIDSHDHPLSSLMQSLTAFRVCCVQFHWDTISFSSRLSELHIEQVTLGYDDKIAPFVQSLASATGLRDLKIISVSTLRRSGTASDSTPLTPVVFPALQSLFIKNLYFNTLEQLLPAVAPGSHRLTLFPTLSSLEVNSIVDGYSTAGSGEIEYDGLRQLLEHTVVDTLMVTGGGSRGNEWLTRFELVGLLKSMPTLKTLKLEQWKFGSDLCKSLTRTNHSHASSSSLIPDLQALYLTSIEICDDKLFREMIVSHSLRQVVLGGFSQGVKAQRGSRAPADPDTPQWRSARTPPAPAGGRTPPFPSSATPPAFLPSTLESILRQSNEGPLLSSRGRGYPFPIVVGPQTLGHGSTAIGLEALREDSNSVQWLRESMPGLDLCLVGPEYSLPEFRDNEWRLW